MRSINSTLKDNTIIKLSLPILLVGIIVSIIAANTIRIEGQFSPTTSNLFILGIVLAWILPNLLLILYIINHINNYNPNSIKKYLTSSRTYFITLFLFFTSSSIFMGLNALFFMFNVDSIQTNHFSYFLNLECGPVCFISLSKVFMFSEGFYPTFDGMIRVSVIFYFVLALIYAIITFKRLVKFEKGRAFLSSLFILSLILILSIFMDLSFFTNFKEILDASQANGDFGIVFTIIQNFVLYYLYLSILGGIYYVIQHNKKKID